MAKSPYDIDLDRNPANYQPLTPLGFLERAAAVFPAHTAVIHGPLRRSYAEFYARTRRLAKMNFVGTTAFFFATVNALKVVPYFALGQFSTKGLGTSLVLLPLAMATNMLGFWVVRITPQELFYKITMALMFLISIELLRSGMVDILHG